MYRTAHTHLSRHLTDAQSTPFHQETIKLQRGRMDTTNSTAVTTHDEAPMSHEVAADRNRAMKPWHTRAGSEQRSRYGDGILAGSKEQREQTARETFGQDTRYIATGLVEGSSEVSFVHSQPYAPQAIGAGSGSHFLFARHSSAQDEAPQSADEFSQRMETDKRQPLQYRLVRVDGPVICKTSASFWTTSSLRD